MLAIKFKNNNIILKPMQKNQHYNLLEIVVCKKIMKQFQVLWIVFLRNGYGVVRPLIETDF